MIVIDKSDLAGSAYMYIVFRADSLVYPPGSIIVGAEVIAIEREGRIIARSTNAIIHIKGDRNFAPSKGDMIICVARKSGYPQGSADMVIVAEPFFIQQNFSMLLVKPEVLKQDEQTLVAMKLQEIEAAERLLKDQDAGLIEFFNETFYPFKDRTTSITKKRNKSPFDVIDIIEIATALSTGTDPLGVMSKSKPIILSRHSAIDKSSTVAFAINPDTIRNLPKHPMTNKDVIGISIEGSGYAIAILALLDDYCSYIQMISACCETFNTDSIRKKHNKLWAIYDHLKVEL